MNHVLITGASGFLGKYIVDVFTQQNWHVSTLGRHSSNSIQCDLAVSVPDLSNINANLVVHAMGKAHMVPSTDAEAQAFFDVNLEGTKRLCSALENAASMPKEFVFISTVAVYGKDEGTDIDEDQPLQGKTPYALSKIQAEQWLQQWCDHNNIRLSMLRLPLVAGRSAPGNLGAMVNGIRTGRYFNISEGKARKSVVLAEDVANWIPKIAAVGGVYNLTDGFHPSFAELATVIAKQLHCNPPGNLPSWVALPAAFAGNFLGSRAPINCDKLRKITATLTFNDAKAKAAFGWMPKPVLESTLV
ncbi:NAD-dependent epimerase/dehydratase family protein [Phnomibacter sp. MR]|uniref:NAD-dependent epimerase/dehydratase family protein n=1 Tax=Phnomibacter sp. MR TaxID=3042318 RepID=UPI003A7FF112